MQKDNYQIIIQFLDGKLSASEKNEFAQWRKASTDNEKQFQEVKFLWQKGKLAKKKKADLKIDVNAALAKVHQQLPQSAKVVPLRRRLLKYVAAASVILIVGLGSWMTFFQQVEMIEVATFAGETRQLTLPDASTVWLNENSRFSYPKEFAQATREVTMIGDVVFEVTHNPQQPFIVKTSDLAVKVLGTKFNVQSDKGNYTSSLVHVLNGKVQVEKRAIPTEKVVLTKDMTVILSNEDDQLELNDSFSSNDLFWVTNALSFKAISLEYVIETINKAYKREITVTNAAALACPFSGTFKDKTVTEILESLQLIYGFEIAQINSLSPQLNQGTCN